MSARRPLLLAFALALVTVASYGGVLANGFVNYDDDLYVTDRSEVRGGLSRPGIVWAFSSLQGANWFPLTRLSWMLDAELFGMRATAFHAVSLFLHVATALLLFGALLRLTRHLWPSAFVAAVFALHPLHVESVAWISARKDVVSGLFFALALLCHERRARSARPGPWALALVLVMGLGLLAKPMLVTLPCVLLLLDAWPLDRLRKGAGARRWGALVLEKLPLFALAVAASVVTIIAQRAGGALQPLQAYPLAIRLPAAIDAYATYLTRAFWPSGLAAFYPHPLGTLPAWRVALAAAALLAITAGVLQQRRARPYLAVGWLWFAGMLVPVSGVVQVGQAAMADRYTYLPLIGLSIMVAWGGRDIATRGTRFARATRSIAVVGLAALAVASAVQVRTWRDSRRLFEHALRVTSGNHVAHINLGQALAGAGLFEEAATQLDAALLLVPASATAWGLRGEIRLAQERFEAAGDDFRAALRLDPGSARWSTGLGRVLAERGEIEAATALLRAALERDPDHAPAHVLLGAVLVRRGQLREALESYERALAREARLVAVLGPEGVARVHAQLATLLERDGRPAEAVVAYREALRLGERSPHVLNNLAWLLATSEAPDLRSPAEAVVLAREAVAVSGGKDPAMLDTLATAQLAAGHRAEARTTAARALALAESQGRQALARSIRTRFELNLGDVPAS